jgi:hypothetical protein
MMVVKYLDCILYTYSAWISNADIHAVNTLKDNDIQLLYTVYIRTAEAIFSFNGGLMK